MTSKLRKRAKRLARRPPFRQPKRRILVLCEGAVTEPEYLRGFERLHRDALLVVEIAPEHGVPLTLVRLACDRQQAAQRDHRRDANLGYDAVWCAFDIDDHPNVGEAREMARDHHIELAISNPCFELWLLLHFRDSPGMQARRDLRRRLDGYLPGYDKHLHFALLADGYARAVDRARRLDVEAAKDDDSGRNPTTGVYRLTESLREPAGFVPPHHQR